MAFLQEAGGIIWRDGSGWNWGRDEDAGAPRFDYVREADYCSAAALMVDKALWGQLGGFDERFAPCYYEDTDFCFSVRERGSACCISLPRRSFILRVLLMAPIRRRV